MPDTAVLTRSVTRDNYEDTPRGGGVLQFLVADGWAQPDLPGYWSPSRDFALAASVDREAMWASAVTIAATEAASLSWDVQGDVGLRVRRAQQMFLTAGGEGWLPFALKNVQDFLTTDNGCFTEVVRATRGAGSRILGLVHLDSCRCTRTGDLEIPVVYRDLKEQEHELRAHQVFFFADMPSPRARWYGVGKCAASRAWEAILKLEGIERYVREKVTGRRALEIHTITGMSKRQLDDAVAAAKAGRTSEGMVNYMGVIIIPALGDTPVQGYRIPLAEIPDGFNADEERKHGQLTYANAIGIDPQTLNPDLLASRALGTGAQSQTIDDKAAGKGMVRWRQQIIHGFNQNMLDESTSFIFTERDYRDLLRSAEVSQARANVVGALVDRTVISPEQGLQVLVDQDELPKEFLPVDQTPDDSLSDTEKPDSEEGAPPPTTEKAASDAVLLMAQEIRRATDAYERANGLE